MFVLLVIVIFGNCYFVNYFGNCFFGVNVILGNCYCWYLLNLVVVILVVVIFDWFSQPVDQKVQSRHRLGRFWFLKKERKKSWD